MAEADFGAIIAAEMAATSVNHFADHTEAVSFYSHFFSFIFIYYRSTLIKSFHLSARFG